MLHMFRAIAWFLVRVPLLLFVFVTALFMSSCTMLGMNYASLETTNKPAPHPELNVSEILQDGAYRTRVMQEFEDVLYGPWPEGMAVRWGETRIVDPGVLGGKGRIEEIPVTIGTGDGASQFWLAVAIPAGEGPFPIVISQTFSSNCAAFPGYPVTSVAGTPCEGSEMEGTIGFVATQIFGTYIAKVPLERFLDAGIAYASFYGSDFVPDRRAEAPDVMENLGGPINPTGTLMAWAYAYSAAMDVLEARDDIDGSAMTLFGHSRFGKAALIAGAWDRRADGVIAHQAGFAGASLSRSETGEGLKRMAESYPHWLAPETQDWLDRLDEMPVDQHQLLGLLAPTPVLLGNGRRDVWSDPNSSFRAAISASEVYVAAGEEGLPAGGMKQDFKPGAGIAWWLRPGGHSIVSEDIDTFIAFIDAQFPDASRRQSAVHAAE
jgi:(4-O-methyl)-D-glucuronate---lignin esterase